VGVDCSHLDDDCIVGACVDGACEAQNTNEGGPCDDGVFCTTGETCTAGVCGGGTTTDCSELDDLPCVSGFCNTETDACDTQVNEGDSCDDGDPCTEGETCQADGSCGGGTDVCVDDCITSLDCGGAGQCCCKQQGRGGGNRCVASQGCTGSNNVGDELCCIGQNKRNTVPTEGLCPGS
jgi:hypothetical protein